METASETEKVATTTKSADVRQFSCSEDPAAADQCISLLSQGLSNDVLVAYLTRNDPNVTADVWQFELRGASRVNPSAQQFFCLRDYSAVAYALEYPNDAPSTWASLLRLMPTVPLGKWRALAEWMNSKEKQKAAFARAHGDFLYLMAITDASGSHEGDTCLPVLQEVCKAADLQQLVIYIEARPKQRPWLKQHGFVDVMGYRVRKKAPHIFIMSRAPVLSPIPLHIRR